MVSLQISPPVWFIMGKLKRFEVKNIKLQRRGLDYGRRKPLKKNTHRQKLRVKKGAETRQCNRWGAKQMKAGKKARSRKDFNTARKRIGFVLAGPNKKKEMRGRT